MTRGIYAIGGILLINLTHGSTISRNGLYQPIKNDTGSAHTNASENPPNALDKLAAICVQITPSSDFAAKARHTFAGLANILPAEEEEIVIHTIIKMVKDRIPNSTAVFCSHIFLVFSILRLRIITDNEFCLYILPSACGFLHPRRLR